MLKKSVIRGGGQSADQILRNHGRRGLVTTHESDC